MSAPIPGCGCLDRVNEKLAERGQYLQSTMLGNPDRPLMQIMRRDTWSAEKRRKMPNTMLPTFCPFCGVQYPGTVAISGEPDSLLQPVTGAA